MFFFKNNEFRKTEMWAGRHVCPCCNKTSDFHLKKTEKLLLAFFIPCLAMINDRYIECDNCNYEQKLRIPKYHKIKKNRYKDLKNKKYPLEMIDKDFSPENLKIGIRLAPIIGMGATISVIATLAFVLTLISGNIHVLSFLIFTLVPGFPFLLSINCLMQYFRKWNWYKHKDKFPSINDKNSGINFDFPYSDAICAKKEK